jgi:hypothetical protein
LGVTFGGIVSSTKPGFWTNGCIGAPVGGVTFLRIGRKACLVRRILRISTRMERSIGTLREPAVLPQVRVDRPIGLRGPLDVRCGKQIRTSPVIRLAADANLDSAETRLRISATTKQRNVRSFAGTFCPRTSWSSGRRLQHTNTQKAHTRLPTTIALTAQGGRGVQLVQVAYPQPMPRYWTLSFMLSTLWSAGLFAVPSPPLPEIQSSHGLQIPTSTHSILLVVGRRVEDGTLPSRRVARG